MVLQAMDTLKNYKIKHVSFSIDVRYLINSWDHVLTLLSYNNFTSIRIVGDPSSNFSFFDDIKSKSRLYNFSFFYSPFSFNDSHFFWFFDPSSLNQISNFRFPSFDDSSPSPPPPRRRSPHSYSFFSSNPFIFFIVTLILLFLFLVLFKFIISFY